MEAGLRDAMRFYIDRDYSAALAILDGIDSTDENHLDLAYLVGLCHARLGKWDEALLYLEQVVTASDDFMRIYQCRLALAYIYSVTGRSRLAEYELNRLLKSGIRSVQVLTSLGFASWEQGKSEAAESLYSEALILDPENATALNGLGYILAYGGKDPEKALMYCRKAVDKSPQNPAYLDSLGWAYHNLGLETEACDFIGRALSLAPTIKEIREHARLLELPDPPE